MENEPWYKRGWTIFWIVIAATIVFNVLSDSGTQAPSTASPRTAPSALPTPVKTLESPSTVTAPTAPVTPKETYESSSLSNDNYYINVDGNRVHSPAYSDSIPSGASAKCRDGTYSFSQNRRGTCSHHGGVSVWY